jgi:hypothetical protein
LDIEQAVVVEGVLGVLEGHRLLTLRGDGAQLGPTVGIFGVNRRPLALGIGLLMGPDRLEAGVDGDLVPRLQPGEKSFVATKTNPEAVGVTAKVAVPTCWPAFIQT